MNELANEFKIIDKNNNGVLSRDEIIEAYQNLKGLDFSIKEVEMMIEKADADNSGEIDYNEWMMTAVDTSKFLSDQKLEGAFKMFDKNGD